MFRLLRRCLESDEPDAWGDLFVVVDEAAAVRVRWVLRHFRVSEMEIECVVVEMFADLHLDDCRKLRSCRAECEAEFRTWIRQVATRFARNWVDRRRRAAIRERAAASRAVLPDRWGPDENAIRACVDEWRPLMASQDFERLLVLIGWVTEEPAVCDRTRRHWTQQLLTKYPDFFGAGP